MVFPRNWPDRSLSDLSSGGKAYKDFAMRLRPDKGTLDRKLLLLGVDHVGPRMMPDFDGQPACPHMGATAAVTVEQEGHQFVSLLDKKNEGVLKVDYMIN